MRIRCQQRDTLRAMQTTLETVTLGQKKLLDDAATITVMGDSELTGDQISAWFEARGVRYQLSGGTTIGELADLFVEEGAAEHVRGDIAFAQSILETGSFGHATRQQLRRNRRVRQLQRRDRVPHAARRRPRPDPDAEELRRSRIAGVQPRQPAVGTDLRVGPRSSARAYDTFFAKGRVPTWNLMGNGNWATAAEYAPRVLGLYFEMVASAARKA